MRVPVWLVSLAFLGLAAAPRAQQDATRAPVLVELFTSEGCASCPPADALLARLVAEQPVAGAHVIALEQHVDYWDDLGWSDPFAAAAFTARQAEYRRRLHLDQLFTPQMIVDGRESLAGADASAARKAIAKAARAPKAAIELSVAIPGRIELSARVSGLHHVQLRQPARLIVAVTEDGLTSNVEHGENRGRQLSHVSVVRAVRAVLEIERGTDTASANVPVLLEASWDRDKLNAVAFVQEGETGRVVAAATTPLR